MIEGILTNCCLNRPTKQWNTAGRGRQPPADYGALYWWMLV